MAATDPITNEVQAQTLIENAVAWDTDPVLTADQVALLLSMAASTDDEGADQWTVSDLNRVVSLGWNWKAAATASSFKVGVGPGKTFDLQQQYEHCLQMAAAYGNGTLSVVGSADASDGTAKLGAKIGTLTMTSVMNT